MAKKITSKKEDSETVEDELSDELFGDDEFPADSSEKTDKDSIISGKELSSESVVKDDIAEKLAQQLELDEIKKEYKYLTLDLNLTAENEYILFVNHQSHGFMNYFISKILKIKGVTYAAYKYTSLEEPKMYIHVDGSKDIKAILKEANKLMRIELKGLANSISALNL